MLVYLIPLPSAAITAEIATADTAIIVNASGDDDAEAEDYGDDDDDADDDDDDEDFIVADDTATIAAVGIVKMYI
jgi:hypothetical protein